MDAPAPGGLGGTYAGNPLAMARRMRCSTSSRSEKLSRARRSCLGDKLKAKLERRCKSEVPQIADVRGLGAMVAVEFCKPGTTDGDADFTKRVQTARAANAACCCSSCGVYGNVRALPVPAHHSGRRVRRSARHPGRRADRNASAWRLDN